MLLSGSDGVAVTSPDAASCPSASTPDAHPLHDASLDTCYKVHKAINILKFSTKSAADRTGEDGETERERAEQPCHSTPFSPNGQTSERVKVWRVHVYTRDLTCTDPVHVFVFMHGVSCRDRVKCPLQEGSNDAQRCSFVCQCNSQQKCFDDGVAYVRVASADEGYLCEVYVQ